MSTDVAPEVAAPVAPDTPSAPDAQTDAAPKRGRAKMNKVAFRAKDSDKLLEWPAQFDPRIHTPLTADDFAAEDVFWDHKAKEYEGRAVQCRKNADLFRKFGSAEKRKSAENAVKMFEKLKALQTELAASGIKLEDLNIDVSAFSV
jgi:hypothetical protein